MGWVGYSCISGSLICALGCVGTSLAKTLGFVLHSEVMFFCSVQHSAHVAQGMRCICCTIGMYCWVAVELSGLNLGYGSLRNI